LRGFGKRQLEYIATDMQGHLDGGCDDARLVESIERTARRLLKEVQVPKGD
jgi:hypothetical protein